MESDKGPVATEAPPFSPPASLRAAPLAPTSVESLAVEAAARATQSLKRQREATPTSPEFDLNTRLDPALSPTKSARLLNVSVRHSPALLTGAAAAEDEKRRQEEQFRLQVAGASDNPAYRAQAALMSVESLAMSRPQDAPATEEHRVENHHAEPHQEMEVEPPTAHQLEQHTEHHVEQPVETHGEHHIAPPAEQHVDPQLVPLPEQHIQNDAEARRQSVSPEHHVPIEASTTAPTTAVESELAAKRDPVADGPADRPIPAEPTVPITESPAPMDVDGRNDRQSSTTQPLATTVEAKGGLSMSYPGSLQATESMSAPTVRGMTLPITPSHAATPRSPNSKKHRCPYCETEFTRHHNLKSHLLTHSQEKPYVCHTCQMRFRRLHDLKRHSKLHTGEKPHICPKCDRKFARGDALARHSKGPGGCVGRRSSMGGSFLDDDMEGHSQLEGDSVMTDVVYDGANDESLTDEDRQRLGMQARNSSHTQGSDKNAETHHAYSSSGPSDSVLEALKSSISNLAANATAESHNETTENYSAQQSYERDSSERHSSPGFSAADAARYAASAAAGATASVANAISAHGLPSQQDLAASSQNGVSGDGTSNNLFATDQGFWTYIHSLEDQVRQFSDRLHAMEATERSQEERISYLTDEVANLRHQIEGRPAVEVEKLD